eukprot:1161854-Pelagomonas_calceolata.AAC.11
MLVSSSNLKVCRRAPFLDKGLPGGPEQAKGDLVCFLHGNSHGACPEIAYGEDLAYVLSLPGGPEQAKGDLVCFLHGTHMVPVLRVPTEKTLLMTSACQEAQNKRKGT